MTDGAAQALRAIRESASVDDAMEAKKSKAQRDNEMNAIAESTQQGLKQPLAIANPMAEQ